MGGLLLDFQLECSSVPFLIAGSIPHSFGLCWSYNPWSSLFGGQKDTLHLPLSPAQQLVGSSPITRDDLDTKSLKLGSGGKMGELPRLSKGS